MVRIDSNFEREVNLIFSEMAWGDIDPGRMIELVMQFNVEEGSGLDFDVMRESIPKVLPVVEYLIRTNLLTVIEWRAVGHEEWRGGPNEKIERLRTLWPVSLEVEPYDPYPFIFLLTEEGLALARNRRH